MIQKNQNRFPIWLFGFVFFIILGIVILNRVLSPAEAQIYVTDYGGAGDLLTQDQYLIAVFQDGKIAAWDWINPSAEPLWKLAASERFVMLDDERAAAVSKTGRKIFTVYNVKTGEKISEIPVGWEDQDIWLLQSPDKKVLALACINPDKDGHTLYEFMLIDPAKTQPEMPFSLDIATAQKRFITFAVSNDKKVLAAGSVGKQGWLAVIDLNQSKQILQKEYPDCQEFTSAAFMPNDSTAFLTNRNGAVYCIDIASGDIKSAYTVLKPGQKNPVTNETASQNIAISDDGKYVAAVVINLVHVWETETGNHIFGRGPGHMLTGPIVFSSDGSLLASSDIRAGRLIKIWKIKK